LCGLEAVCL
jgi:hypothetical protein